MSTQLQILTLRVRSPYDVLQKRVLRRHQSPSSARHLWAAPHPRSGATRSTRSTLQSHAHTVVVVVVRLPPPPPSPRVPTTVGKQTLVARQPAPADDPDVKRRNTARRPLLHEPSRPSSYAHYIFKHRHESIFRMALFCACFIYTHTHTNSRQRRCA